MIRWMELLSVARATARFGSESFLRSAASRGYYGAFHYAGERLESLTSTKSGPFRWLQVRKDHQDLQQKWSASGHSNGLAIANNLHTAHELRKKADYDLDKNFTKLDLDALRSHVAQVIILVRNIKHVS